MRLGAPILTGYKNPEEWVALVLEEGYGAAYCPVDVGAEAEEVERYAQAAEEAGIVIAEVGAWAANALSSDPAEAERSIVYSQRALELAERIGARCCVNIAGTTGPVWAGHAAENFTESTFKRIVETVQAIIDGVEPEHTFYAIEVMPWIAPEDAESYIRLLAAIDRERCAVHFDPANMVNDPRKYYSTGELMTEFVDKLGPHIRSCHAKDIRLDEEFPPWTVRLWECVPGSGNLDWDALLTELARLDPDLPLMLEHLETTAEYRTGSEHIRTVAANNGIAFVPAGSAHSGSRG